MTGQNEEHSYMLSRGTGMPAFGRIVNVIAGLVLWWDVCNTRHRC